MFSEAKGAYPKFLSPSDLFSKFIQKFVFLFFIQ